MFSIKTKVTLNDFPQSIHIWGTKESNPVLLILHGGPGGANRNTVRKHYTDAFLDDFTVVAWDQRGTAGSYEGCDFSKMTISLMVEDARALAEWLCERFDQRKIHICGGSWGTELGTYLAYRYPEHIAAYVGYGQLVDAVKNEELSYQFTLDEATKHGNQRELKILREVGPPVRGQYTPMYDGMMKQRDIMKKYGGHNVKKGGYFLRAYLPVIFSTEYTFKEKLGMSKGMRRSIEALWPEMGNCNFMENTNEFQMPYFIFQGRYDQNTPSALVPAYFEKLKAPVKELVWFENSAHSPFYEEPEKFKALLREKLLPIDTRG